MRNIEIRRSAEAPKRRSRARVARRGPTRLVPTNRPDDAGESPQRGPEDPRALHRAHPMLPVAQAVATADPDGLGEELPRGPGGLVIETLCLDRDPRAGLAMAAPHRFDRPLSGEVPIRLVVGAGRKFLGNIGYEQAECARTLLVSRIVVAVGADGLESAKVALHEWAAEKMERERQSDDGYDPPKSSRTRRRRQVLRPWADDPRKTPDSEHGCGPPAHEPGPLLAVAWIDRESQVGVGRYLRACRCRCLVSPAVGF